MLNVGDVVSEGYRLDSLSVAAFVRLVSTAFTALHNAKTISK
jgi:hypothetical protein